MPCLEIIVDTVEDAIAAETGGATQITVLSHYPSTGVTPSYGMVERIYEMVKIPILVLICPHTRGYIPSSEDMETCLRDIEAFRKLGIRDFLIGFIDQSNNLNVQAIDKIKKAQAAINLHSRIIWEFTRDIQKTVETTISLGFRSIRTNGNCMTNTVTNGKSTESMKNISLIKDLAMGKIEILLTGGITLANMDNLVNQTDIFDLQIGRGVRTPSNSYSPVDPVKVAAIRTKQTMLFKERNLED
ncbi:MAG: copper homeostasis protein CutC [Anaerolineaceae bacterium]